MANTSRVRSRKRAKNDIRHLVPLAAATQQPEESIAEQPLNLCVRDDVTPSTIEQPEKTTSRRRKKRSAIFLPPEKLNENNVCICKFKFVAGDSPRLQEKKVLSLDAGGNFKFFPEAPSPSTTPTIAKPLPDLLPIENNGAWGEGKQRRKQMSRRQKMEQTFGEKGFLIQTQHVPATEGGAFCKFRQLKKFTRYLYRSWRHYLPQDSQQPTD